MDKLATIATSVRIYNIGVCYENAIEVCEAAKRHGMRVVIGLWMEANNTAVFEKEFSLLPEFMSKYSDMIEYVVVGNEPVFIELVDVYEVIETYRRVKTWMVDNGYNHPCSVAEVWPVWETEEGKELAAALDFVCMNMQPYWEGFYAVCPDNEPDCVPAGRLTPECLEV